MSFRLNYFLKLLTLILHAMFLISNMTFMLNSAGMATTEKSAEVTEKPLKTPAAAPEVGSVRYCSIGCRCLLFCVLIFPFLSRSLLLPLTMWRSRPLRKSCGRNAFASRKWRSRPKARPKRSLLRNSLRKDPPWRGRFLLKSALHAQALHHLPPPLWPLTRPLFVNWSPSNPRLLHPWTLLLEQEVHPQSLRSGALLQWRLSHRAPAAPGRSQRKTQGVPPQCPRPSRPEQLLRVLLQRRKHWTIIRNPQNTLQTPKVLTCNCHACFMLQPMLLFEHKEPTLDLDRQVKISDLYMHLSDLSIVCWF